MNTLWCYCVILYARGTHSSDIVIYFTPVDRPVRGTRLGVILVYFMRMERCLKLLCYIFCSLETLCRYCVIVSAGLMRFGILR